MNKLQFSEMGPRHLSTTWTLLRPSYGQWFVSEVRHYDNDGAVVTMPKRAVPYNELDDALDSIPDSAVEQQSATTMRSWRYDTPIRLAC